MHHVRCDPAGAAETPAHQPEAAAAGAWVYPSGGPLPPADGHSGTGTGFYSLLCKAKTIRKLSHAVEHFVTWTHHGAWRGTPKDGLWHVHDEVGLLRRAQRRNSTAP